jgi:acyl dehydratase
MSFTPQHLFFDDVTVGQEWISVGRTVTEADLVNFAGISGDYNPIHMDAEFARSTPYKGRLAHGLLILSFGSGLAIYCPPMRTLAFKSIQEWLFKEPVFIGDTVRLRARVLNIAPRARGRRAEVTWLRQIVNQHDKVVQEGKTVTLVEGRASVAQSAGTTERENDEEPSPLANPA